MKQLTLTHPKHGYIDSRIIIGKYTKEVIKQQWRWRYGLKIKECVLDCIENKKVA